MAARDMHTDVLEAGCACTGVTSCTQRKDSCLWRQCACICVDACHTHTCCLCVSNGVSNTRNLMCRGCAILTSDMHIQRQLHHSRHDPVCLLLFPLSHLAPLWHTSHRTPPPSPYTMHPSASHHSHSPYKPPTSIHAHASHNIHSLISNRWIRDERHHYNVHVDARCCMERRRVTQQQHQHTLRAVLCCDACCVVIGDVVCMLCCDQMSQPCSISSPYSRHSEPPRMCAPPTHTHPSSTSPCLATTTHTL